MKILKLVFGLMRALFSFVWKNTEVEVPLGENINNYSTKPYVEVYDYNLKVAEKNDNIDYSITTNYATFNEINTQNIGSYYVEYVATYNKSSEHQSTCKVVFRIVDKIPPTFNVKGDFKYDVGRKISAKEMILRHFIPHDNYGKIRNIEKEDETIEYSRLLYEEILYYDNINFNEIGKYKITYKLSDYSGNVTYYDQIVDIVDKIPPTITKIKGLRLLMKTKFNWENFIKVSDNYDKFIQDVNYEIFGDTSVPGKYKITITAKDSSGNTTTYNDILVVGANPPSLVLDTDIILSVNDIKYMDKLKDAVIRIDHYSNNYTISDVKITPNIIISKIGKYSVKYEIIDKDDKSVLDTKEIFVYVKDLEEPIVRFKKPFELPLNSEKLDIFDFFEISDNYDKLSDLKISQINKSDYNLNKIGRYFVRFSVSDKSGNVRIVNEVLRVKDVINPTMELVKDLKLEYMSKFDLRSFFKLSDDVDKEEELRFNYQIEDGFIKKLGKYKLIASVADRSYNVNMKIYELEVVDTKPPQIELRYETFNYYIGSKEPNFYDNIEKVYDNETNLTIRNVKIVKNFDLNKPGKYELFYKVLDNSKNMGTARMIVYSDFKIFPKLELPALTIDRKDRLDQDILMQGINPESIKDYKVQILSDIPRDLEAGKYIIKYRLINKRGYTNDYERELIIVENKKKRNIYIAISVMSILSFSAILTLFLLFKKRSKNKENYTL